MFLEGARESERKFYILERDNAKEKGKAMGSESKNGMSLSSASSEWSPEIAKRLGHPLFFFTVVTSKNVVATTAGATVVVIVEAKFMP